MSRSKDNWLLPDGVEELLPGQASRLEKFRRIVLDSFSLSGYQLVQPPLIEFLDSLHTGAGHDLDLLTFKVTDQNSGRMMGVRADMTPQISRIDAHVLKHKGINRLCYVGSVLQTHDRSGFNSREPIQFGAECFGHDGEQADVEIIRLCADIFRSLGIENLHFDLGHVGVFNALVEQAGFDAQQSDDMLDICLRKSWPDMQNFINVNQITDANASIFSELLYLEGHPGEVFQRAQQLFENCTENVKFQFETFKRLVDLLTQYVPELTLSVDFLELRGINYHTGVVFSAYKEGHAHALVKGGRYDDVGRAFGRARPATGFSADLRKCLNILTASSNESTDIILAKFSVDQEQKAFINQLRENGQKVVIGLDGEDETKYRQFIVYEDSAWIVREK